MHTQIYSYFSWLLTDVKIRIYESVTFLKGKRIPTYRILEDFFLLHDISELASVSKQEPRHTGEGDGSSIKQI